MFKITNFVQSAKRKILYCNLLPLIFIFFIFAANPAYAGTAQSTDKFVQCNSSGVVTNNTAITGVNLPTIQYDTSGDFYVNSVDVAVYTGNTLVKELDGFTTTNLQVALGAVTNYDYDSINPVVYEIKFRGHYGVVGEGAQDITENWQRSGLYFQVVQNYPTTGTGGGGSGGSTLPPQPVNSTTGSATVTPAAGGTVGLGSEASVTIPANALQGSDSAQVALQKADSPPAAPSGFMVMGAAYQFTVNSQDHYNFNHPVTLTFTFDPSKLAPGETPAVYYYDETKGQWVNIGGTVSGNTITVSVEHFTKYAVLVKETTPPAQKPAVTLTDISGHWAEANINKLVAMGAISGYPDGTFKPDNTITRAEFAAVLVKAFKLEAKQGKVFADTVKHWARDAISTAAANGIISGYSNDSFGPDDPVTREQMAVMIVKAAKLNPASGKLAFTDSEKISAWAGDAVLTAVRDGIIKGYPDNTFRPGGNATRTEAVTVIVNALNK